MKIDPRPPATHLNGLYCRYCKRKLEHRLTSNRTLRCPNCLREFSRRRDDLNRRHPKDSRGPYRCRLCEKVLRPGRSRAQARLEADRLEWAHCLQHGNIKLGRNGRPVDATNSPFADEVSEPASPFAKPLVRRPLAWIWYQRFLNLLRHINAQVVAVASIIIGLVALLPDGNPSLWRLVAVFVVGPIVGLLTGVISLYHIPPSVYATLVLEGRSTDAQIRWTSSVMSDLCGSFIDSRHTRALRLLQERMHAHLEWLLTYKPSSRSGAGR